MSSTKPDPVSPEPLEPTLIMTVLGRAAAATCTVSIWLGGAGTGVRCGSLETVLEGRGAGVLLDAGALAVWASREPP